MGRRLLDKGLGDGAVLAFLWTDGDSNADRQSRYKDLLHAGEIDRSERSAKNEHGAGERALMLLLADRNEISQMT